MWFVYNASTNDGFEVPTELEAVEYCRENPGYSYIWK